MGKQEIEGTTPEPLDWEHVGFLSSIAHFRHPLIINFRLRVFKKPYSNSWTFHLCVGSGAELFRFPGSRNSRLQAIHEAEKWWEAFRKGFAIDDQQLAASEEGGAA